MPVKEYIFFLLNRPQCCLEKIFEAPLKFNSIKSLNVSFSFIKKGAVLLHSPFGGFPESCPQDISLLFYCLLLQRQRGVSAATCMLLIIQIIYEELRKSREMV